MEMNRVFELKEVEKDFVLGRKNVAYQPKRESQNIIKFRFSSFLT